MQKEMQKQMTMMVAVPVTKEGRRLEAALGRSIEKAVKANADALWARIQEENVKNEKSLRERFQQISSLISNFMNKDLLAILDKTVKKEMAAVGPAVVRAISPAIEKTISSAIVESFQVSFFFFFLNYRPGLVILIYLVEIKIKLSHLDLIGIICHREEWVIRR